jgi:hypothetical protein
LEKGKWKALEKLMGSGTWPPNRGFIKATPITLTPGMKIEYGDFIWVFHDRRIFDPGGIF